MRPRVRLSRDLFERAKLHAEAAGYSSVEELVAHLLEMEIAQVEQVESEDIVERRLKGLGYLA